MLIMCPECNKEISDKSDKCIHCGFPLDKTINNKMCNINGVDCNLSDEFGLLINTDYMQGLRNLRDKYNLSIEDATTLGSLIKSTKEIPKEYNSSNIEKYRDEINIKSTTQNIPHCPTCDSTNIQKIGLVERGASVLMIGLFSKKINKSFKCGNCGYTW